MNEAGVIVSFCSFQNHLAPPEYRKWRRVHGLQLPLHPQQVAGWLALLGFGAATFLVLIPALGSTLHSPLLVVLASLFLIHVSSHLTALLLDPSDPHLRLLKVSVAVPEFDRSKHAHVIENGRCHLCNILTSSPRTKHCSVCNKCVERFDHHCKWLNHCVGGRNYVAFVVCVVSAVAASLVVVAVSVAELVFYHIDPRWLSLWENYNSTTSEETPSLVSITVFTVKDTIFLAVVGSLGILAAITAGLLLHLCLFHVYISFLGITTYEYIRSYRHVSGINAVGPSGTLNPTYEAELRRQRGRFKMSHCCGTSVSITSRASPNAIAMPAEEQMRRRRCLDTSSPFSSRNEAVEGDDRDRHCPLFVAGSGNHRHRILCCCPSVSEQSCATNGHVSCRDKSRASCETGRQINGAKSEGHSKFISYFKTPRARKGTPIETEPRGNRSRRWPGCCHTAVEYTNDRKSTEEVESTAGQDDTVGSENIEMDSKQPCRHQFFFYGNLWTCVMQCQHRGAQSETTAPNVRCNQVLPSSDSPAQNHFQPRRLLVVPAMEENILKHSPDFTPVTKIASLPALAPPTRRRRLRSVADLKKLSDALAMVQEPQREVPDVETLKAAFLLTSQRRQRRKSIHRTRSPVLSPIRESGFSNPSSPQLSVGVYSSPASLQRPTLCASDTRDCAPSKPIRRALTDDDDVDVIVTVRPAHSSRLGNFLLQ
ncbi:uncharacterized protein LOC110827420 [Zootermopsis nevadensis]|uniref:uncharacterized protein LOC110827420 n=1 Tax=Zootermopsis nevadensis TaxID=136037 RepID=UPI000B8E7687|nr:uncharacterized protein LOC110827420 [Zootermopsis nevadensis]